MSDAAAEVVTRRSAVLFFSAGKPEQSARGNNATDSQWESSSSNGKLESPDLLDCDDCLYLKIVITGKSTEK
jgi:hypothetical protein